MPTDRQLAANRENARKSTGPRSLAGRNASRRNALRHGLAIGIGADPAFNEDIEKLAKALCFTDETQGAGEPAREIAEAELDLWRIRKIRAMLFDTYYVAKILVPDRLMQLNDKLAKLERYERREFSRRKRALRALQ
jgi:hypothetical protein